LFGFDGHQPIFDLPQEILPNDTVAAQFYGPRLLSEDRDLGVRFMAGYLKAVAQYDEGNTPRNLDIIEGFTGLPRDLLEVVCLPPVNPAGEVNTAGVDATQEYLIDAGYVEEFVPADEYYDGSIVEDALALLNG
jgi:NitT/TauT family transport system substrate-binding protein